MIDYKGKLFIFYLVHEYMNITVTVIIIIIIIIVYHYISE